jgi:hypothetical protein
MKEKKSISEIRQIVDQIYKRDEDLNKQIYNSKKLKKAFKAGIWEGLLHYYDVKFIEELEKVEL